MTRPVVVALLHIAVCLFFAAGAEGGPNEILPSSEFKQLTVKNVQEFLAAPGRLPIEQSSADSSAIVSISTSVRSELAELLHSYAPQIWFHSQESFGPSDPLQFISGSSLWKQKSKMKEKVFAPGEIIPSFLKAVAQDNAASLEPSEAFLQRVRDKEEWENAPVFWKLSEHPLMKRLNDLVLLEYWYFLDFSKATSIGIGNHPGDWEGIAVLVDWSDGNHYPIAVYYSAHDSGTWHCASEVTWANAKIELSRVPALVTNRPQRRNPEAFSARGTHATYHQEGQTFPMDATERGHAWAGWKNLKPMALEPYYGFAGTWGARRSFPFSSGPIAPGPGVKPLLKGDISDELRALNKLSPRCQDLARVF